MLLSKEVISKNMLGYGLLSRDKLSNHSIFGPSYDSSFYNAGYENIPVTGGWSDTDYSVSAGYAKVAPIKNPTNIQFDYTGTDKASIIGTGNTIDLANYTKLKAKVNITTLPYNAKMYVANAKGTTHIASNLFVSSGAGDTGEQELSLDISSINDSLYVAFYASVPSAGTGCNMTISKVWVE